MSTQATRQLAPLQFKDLKYILVDEIVRNLQNPREPISREEVDDLRKSIEIVGGILVPLVVYQREDKKYVLLDGERRWRAAKQLGLEQVPANILEKPYSDFDNLRTMFNIHQQRKDWSTAARAIALGRMTKMRQGASLSDTQLMDITGMNKKKIEEAKLLLRCPSDLVARCLKGELDEYYLILLVRGLDRCFKAYPDMIQKYEMEETIRSFVRKLDEGWVQDTRASLVLSRIASKCLDLGKEALFKEVFQKLHDDPKFTYEDAEREVDSQLGFQVEERFKRNCRDFLLALRAYRSQKGKTIPKESQKLLQQIAKIIRRIT